jgi:hypothetical protein
MAPVSRKATLSLAAAALAVELFPEPAGPSIATIIFALVFSFQLSAYCAQRAIEENKVIEIYQFATTRQIAT